MTKNKVINPDSYPIGPEGMDLIDNRFMEVYQTLVADTSDQFLLRNLEYLKSAYNAVSYGYRNLADMPKGKEG